MTTIPEAAEAAKILRQFISHEQMIAMADGVRSGEGEFFKDKFVEMANIISNMPKTYEQENKGDDAIVFLHYFLGNMDWYITEKDMGDEQIQAFGLADLGMGFPELGYISIEEIIGTDAELDLHWMSKTLAEVKAS